MARRRVGAGAGSAGDPGEWEAYRFARYFLMDEQGVRALVTDMRDQEQRVAAVASEYNVSPEVAAIHLKVIGLAPRRCGSSQRPA